MRMQAAAKQRVTGFPGSIIRKIALERSNSSLKKALTLIKTKLENDTSRP